MYQGCVPSLLIHGVRPAIAAMRRALKLSEETFDTRRLLWLLRRHRVIIVACVLVGALIPTALMLSHSTSYTATSLVLVPNPANSASSEGSGESIPADSNATDSVYPAASSAVLGAAGSKVTPRLSTQTAQKRVSATVLATNLVQIKATGSSPCGRCIGQRGGRATRWFRNGI